MPDGAPVAIRGTAPDGPGYWFPPTVLCPVDRDDRAVREEIFGPVAVVVPFDDEAEAVALANDTIYGLSGSIWTRDGAKALRVARAIETGVLSINSNTSVRVSTPFGGFKQSGFGRELGPHALDHYTEVKTVYYATISEPARGQGVRDHRAPPSGIGAETAALFRAEGATVVGVDLRDDCAGATSRSPATSPTRSRCAAMYARAREAFGQHRRAVQQRRHLPQRRRVGARHVARGVAARAGRQPQVGLPVLQARHPAPARRPAAAR